MPDILYIPIKDLKTYDKNPRQISKEDFEKLKNDIKEDEEFFHDRPCLVNKVGDTLTVYAGNQRLRAAKQAGLKRVPCIVREDVPADVMERRVIKDNLHRGDWDFDKLNNEWNALDLIDWGISEQILSGIKDSEIIQDDEDSPEDEQIKCPSCGKKMKVRD